MRPVARPAPRPRARDNIEGLTGIVVTVQRKSSNLNVFAAAFAMNIEGPELLLGLLAWRLDSL